MSSYEYFIMQIVEWYCRKSDLGGSVGSLKISQWENLNVLNVNVFCMTGVHRGKEKLC